MIRRTGLALSITLGLALAIALLVGMTASSQGVLVKQMEAGISQASECRGYGGGEKDSDMVWRSTVVMENYEPYSTVTSSYLEELFGNLTTPYTFHLSQIDGERLSDVSLSWAGDGNCTRGANNDILCTGSVENLSISYRCFFTPSRQGSQVFFSFSPPSDREIEYGFHFFFLPRLFFMTSTLTPTWYPEPDIGLYRLYWYRANMQNFETQVTFRDPSIAFLPIVMNNH